MSNTISRNFPPKAFAPRVCQGFQKHYANDRSVQSALTLYKNIGIKPGNRIVEVGPNSETNMAIAAQILGAHYVGFELHADTVNWVRRELQYEEKFLPRRFEHVKLVAGEFSSGQRSQSKHGQYRLEDRSQDCVLMLSGVLSDSKPELFTKEIFEEALRVVKPDAKIVVRSSKEKDNAQQVIQKVLESPAWKDKVKLHLKGDIQLLRNFCEFYEVEFLD